MGSRPWGGWKPGDLSGAVIGTTHRWCGWTTGRCLAVVGCWTCFEDGASVFASGWMNKIGESGVMLGT